jgi:hypothetical protein
MIVKICKATSFICFDLIHLLDPPILLRFQKSAEPSVLAGPGGWRGAQVGITGGKQ